MQIKTIFIYAYLMYFDKDLLLLTQAIKQFQECIILIF